MKNLISVLFTSFVLAFSSFAVSAGDEGVHDETAQTGDMQTGDMQAQPFSEVDADNSGTLNLTEAQNAEVEAETFEEADEDGNGELDRDEYYAAITNPQQ